MIEVLPVSVRPGRRFAAGSAFLVILVLLGAGARGSDDEDEVGRPVHAATVDIEAPPDELLPLIDGADWRFRMGQFAEAARDYEEAAARLPEGSRLRVELLRRAEVARSRLGESTRR